MSRNAIAVWVLAIAAAVVALAMAPGDTAFQALLGWLIYAQRVLPNVTIRWDAVVAFLLGLVVLTVLLQRIASWLRREMSETSPKWRWRSSLLVVGLLIMMFVAGIIIVGLTHQVIWLASEDAPLYTQALKDNPGWPYSGKLKQVGLGVDNFHDTYERLPTVLPVHQDYAEHSWVTLILPYVNYEVEMDLSKPWDHIDNQPVARKLMPLLLNPALRPMVLRDADGYGVIHLAGNTHLFDQEELSIPDIADGTSNTLMIGEVNANYQPWAKPRANRDPALGLNRSPNGFGGPSSHGGTLFVMADGSVKSVSNDIDPALFKALGTPNGND